jgi:hypothetical protein
MPSNQQYSIYKYIINAYFDTTVSAAEETPNTSRFLGLDTEMTSGFSKSPGNGGG